jgi:uncharacterized membrane protein (UPF0127 family)
MRWLLYSFLVIALLAVFPKLGIFGAQENTQGKTLKINDVTINVGIADTDEKRVQGLSGREKLSENEGLLFVFEKEGYYGFWMKDMNFPIDIIWLDKDKKVIKIESSISPETYPKVFSPSSLSLYVLETNSGFAQKSKIKIGDLAEF